MTEQKAIELLRFAFPKEITKPITEEVISMAVSALEKQIPKKPKELCKEALVKDGIFVWECSCGRFHRNDFLLNYCSECGQKIDWEEVED